MNQEQVIQRLQGTWKLDSTPFFNLRINGNKIQQVLAGEVKEGKLALQFDEKLQIWRIDMHAIDIYAGVIENLTGSRFLVRDHPPGTDQLISNQGTTPEGRVYSFKKVE